MKRFLTLASAAFLVISSTGFALAQDPPPPVDPLLTGDGSGYVAEPVATQLTEAAATQRAVASLAAEGSSGADANYVIAWDTSNGATPMASANHGSLIAELQSRGYTVGTIDISTDGIPDNVDTLVVTSLRGNGCLAWPFYSADLTDYGDGRAASIASAVYDGGLSVLLLNEFGSNNTCPGSCGCGTKPIADALEAPWYGVGWSPIFIKNKNYTTPASLFDGVDSWEVSNSSRYITDVGVVVTYNTDPPMPAMIAKEYGSGCAVIVGDTNWATDWPVDDPRIDRWNNRTLANNVFDFLQTCGAVIPNQPPVADANNPYLAAAGSELVLNGTGSYDPDGGPLPLTYAWELGDGNTGVGATPTHTYAAAGIYDVCLTVDDGAAQDTACVQAVIYDPSAGFVTGAGWIFSPPGAYVPEPDLYGDAHFAFVSRYKKGEKVPSGQTTFKFNAADLKFQSTSYEWLVVTGANDAKFKGSGTINGEGSYKFMVWAGDGVPDTFRIKIWYEEANTEILVFDSNDCDGCKAQDTGISSGNIIIHGAKK